MTSALDEGVVVTARTDERVDGAGVASSGAAPRSQREPRRADRSRVTLRQRVAVISIVGAVFTALILNSAFDSMTTLSRANHALTRLAKAQRLHQDADMMHDALRADVFDALLVGEGGNDTTSEVHQEFELHANQMQRDLDGIQALELPAELRTPLARVRVSLATYLGSAHDIIDAAFNDRASAIAGVEAFDAAFLDLAVKQERVTTELARARSRMMRRVSKAESAGSHRIAFSSLAGLAGLLMMTAMLNRLVRPIKELAGAAERLGGGDFSARATRAGIPEIDKVSDAFNTTAERLGEMITRERAFSADASHQLRTPLTGLRLRLEHTLQSSAVDRDEALRDGIRLLDQLEATVEGLLALAREVPRTQDVLDVGALMADAADESRAQLNRLARAVIVECDANLPVVRASQVAVREIIKVLISNAIVHGEGTVTLRARDTGAGVSIEVEDQGPGVSGNPDAIFARRSQSASGYGIGLALARSLASAECGRLVLMRSAPCPVFALVLLAESE